MKPQLLLLHGALGASQQFSSLEKLLESNFEILKLDFSGHGKKESTPSKFSIELFSNEVLNFLAENKIDSIPIFGYSMGGFVALFLALHHPAKVKKISTLATKFEWTPEIAVAEIKFLNPKKTIEKVPAFAQQLQQLHGDKWPELMQKTAVFMQDLGANNPLPYTKMEAIKCPVLLCLGDKDKMVSEAETRTALKALPLGHMHLFKDCAHALEQVNLAALSAQLIQFF